MHKSKFLYVVVAVLAVASLTLLYSVITTNTGALPVDNTAQVTGTNTVVITATTSGTNQVVLSLSDINETKGPAKVSFVIERATSSPSSRFVTLQLNYLGAIGGNCCNANSYPWTINYTATDSGLTPGTTYYYKATKYTFGINPVVSNITPVTIPVITQTSCSSVTLSVTQASVSTQLQSGSVTITPAGAPNCIWTALSSAPSWLSITSANTGTGVTNLSYQVAANTGSARTGTITVNNATLTVNQAGTTGPLPTVSLWITPVSVIASGGSATLNWNSTNATQCTAPWVLNGWYYGEEVQSNVTHSTDYSITCTGPGGSVTSPVVHLIVDSTPPTVTMTGPANGANVSGVINISATASDNNQFKDMSLLKGSGSPTIAITNSKIFSPVSLSCDTRSLPNGSYKFGAKASDSVGNVSPVAQTTVNISNPPAPTPTSTWIHYFGGPGTVDGPTNQISTLDSQGNLITVGRLSADVDFGDGCGLLTGSGGIYIAKYSATGQYLWSHRYGGGSSDSATGVTVDSSDNVIMSATVLTNGQNQDLGFGSFQTHGGSDIVLAKFTPAGALTWAKEFGGTGSDDSSVVAYDKINQRIILTGNYDFFGTGFDVGTGALPRHGGNAQDVFVASLHDDGAAVWAKDFGGADSDYVSAVTVDSTGNIYFGGQYLSPSIDLTQGTGSAFSNGGAYDAYIAKLNSSGTYISGSARHFGNTSDQKVTKLAVDSSNNLIAMGTFQNTVDFGVKADGSHVSFTPQNTVGDTYLVKYAPSGTLIWARKDGDSPDGNIKTYDFAIDKNGRIFYGGETPFLLTFGGYSGPSCGTVGCTGGYWVSPGFYIVGFNGTTGDAFYLRGAGTISGLRTIAANPVDGSLYLGGTTQSGNFTSEMTFGSTYSTADTYNQSYVLRIAAP